MGMRKKCGKVSRWGCSTLPCRLRRGSCPISTLKVAGVFWILAVALERMPFISASTTPHFQPLSSIFPRPGPLPRKRLPVSIYPTGLTSFRVTFLLIPWKGPLMLPGFPMFCMGKGAEGCAAVLAKVKEALAPGGMILIQEFILNDSLDGPIFPALFSLNMLLGTGSGQAYSWGQLEDMLSAAGFQDLRRLSLQLPNGAGVIAAVRA